jgi:hypothetical protein
MKSPLETMVNVNVLLKTLVTLNSFRVSGKSERILETLVILKSLLEILVTVNSLLEELVTVQILSKAPVTVNIFSESPAVDLNSFLETLLNVTRVLCFSVYCD